MSQVIDHVQDILRIPHTNGFRRSTWNASLYASRLIIYALPAFDTTDTRGTDLHILVLTIDKSVSVLPDTICDQCNVHFCGHTWPCDLRQFRSAMLPNHSGRIDSSFQGHHSRTRTRLNLVCMIFKEPMIAIGDFLGR